VSYKLKLPTLDYDRASACVARVDIGMLEWCDYACKRYAKRRDLVEAWAVASDERMGSATKCATIGGDWLRFIPHELLAEDKSTELANFARRAIMRAVELAEVANELVPSWLGAESVRVMVMNKEVTA
jgi:hypothetical protein